MSSVYCTTLAGQDDGILGVNYILADDPVRYSADTTTYGPVHTPRIHASNLDTLELASSGRMSLTVSDVHAIDLTRDRGSNTTRLNVITAGDTFQITAASMALDASNVEIAGALSVSRGAGVSVVSTVHPGDTLGLSASNISLAGAVTVWLSNARSVLAAQYPLVLTAPSLALVDTLSVSRGAGVSVVSTVHPGDTLGLSASNISLAGAVTVGLCNDSMGVPHSVFNTNSPMVFDAPTLSLVGTLQVSPGLVDAKGRVQVSGTMGVAGGFDSLSSAAGVITLGTLDASGVGGIAIGDSATSSNSFLWHGQPDASHWELVGGDLRVTRVRTGVPMDRTVSYTIRIADDDALEIHQRTSNSSGESSRRRVARFGGASSNK